MSWTDATDPSDTWSDTSGDAAQRHTYGAEYGKTTRIVYGDNVRFGGGYDPVSDPATTGSDATDPSNSWSDANDPSNSWSDA